MSIAFLLTTLVVVATPGTGAVYSIAAGLSRGSRAGIIAAFGCTLGVLPHMVAAITGLAAILHASAIAFQAIKWLPGWAPCGITTRPPGMLCLVSNSSVGLPLRKQRTGMARSRSRSR